MLLESTLLILKPETIHGRLVGCVLDMLNLLKNPFEIEEIWINQVEKKIWKEFYKHIPKDICEEYSTYLSNNKCIFVILKGENIITNLKKLLGATNPEKADLLTIRQRFGKEIDKNIAHASENKEDFERECNILGINLI